MTGNRDVIPFYSDEFKNGEDGDYYPRVDSVNELSEYWQKSQKQLDRFWESWKRDYLLNLRETLPLFHRNKSTQLIRQPRIGEVVIVRDDHTPRRAWRLAKIKEFIFSKDRLTRSVKIQLPNKNIVSRAINHLYPLEITSKIAIKRLKMLWRQLEIIIHRILELLLEVLPLLLVIEFQSS